MDKDTTKSMAFGYSIDDLPCRCACGTELGSPLSECGTCDVDVYEALEIDQAAA